MLPQSEVGYAAFLASTAVQQGTVTKQQEDHWQLRYRGLRLDYWPATGRGRIRGSLHTFFHGHNSEDFVAADVPAACQALADAVGLPMQALQVEHLEVGINLPLPSAPTAFLDGLLAHKNSRFYPSEPPPRATRPLLFGAAHHDYRLKAYDKGAYNRLQGQGALNTTPHLLRFEVVYTRARPLWRLLQCSALTLEVIAQPAAVEQLAQELRQHWYNVEHRFEPDFAGLDVQDMLLLHAATAPALWKAARQTVPARTLTRHRTRSRLLRQQAEQTSPLTAYHQCFERHLCGLLSAPMAECSNVGSNRQLHEQWPTHSSAQAWPRFHTCNQVESTSQQSIPTRNTNRSAELPLSTTQRDSKPALPSEHQVVDPSVLADDLRQPADDQCPLHSDASPKYANQKNGINHSFNVSQLACPAGTCADIMLARTASTLLTHKELRPHIANQQVRPPPAYSNPLYSGMRLC